MVNDPFDNVTLNKKYSMLNRAIRKINQKSNSDQLGQYRYLLIGNVFNNIIKV